MHVNANDANYNLNHNYTFILNLILNLSFNPGGPRKASGKPFGKGDVSPAGEFLLMHGKGAKESSGILPSPLAEGGARPRVIFCVL